MTTTIQDKCEALLRRCERYQDRFAAFDSCGGSEAEADRLLEQCQLLQTETLRQLCALEHLEAQTYLPISFCVWRS